MSARSRADDPRHIGLAALGAHYLIRGYQLTLSAVLGRHCRHLPTCSCYMDEAIARHGLWAGGWVGVARICRCNPWGSSGLDFVPATLPTHAAWWRPWSYGRWRGTNELGPSPGAASGEASAGDGEAEGEAAPAGPPEHPPAPSNAAAAAAKA